MVFKSPEEYQAHREKQQRGARRRNRILLVLGITGALSVGIWQLPKSLLAGAEERANACFRRLAETGAEDPGVCADGGIRLAIAHIAPWTSANADAIERDLDHRRARNALAIATTRTPDAAARSRAADRLIAWARAGTDTELDNAYMTLERAGAFADAIRLGTEEVHVGGTESLASAYFLGDNDGLDAILSTSDKDLQVVDLFAKGVASCLRGDAERGRARLAETRSQLKGTLWLGLELAQWACGEKALTGDNRHALSLLLAAEETRGGGHPGLRPSKYDPGWDRLPAAALVALNEHQSVDELLEILNPGAETPSEPGTNIPQPRWDRYLTPWIYLHGPSSPDDARVIAPDLAERAAARLVALAERVPTPGRRPRDDVAESARLPYWRRVLGAQTLRFSSFSILLEAAREWAWRGKSENCLAALDKAADLGFEQYAFLLATGRAAAGDAAGALALLDQTIAAESFVEQAPNAQALIRLQRALALASLARFDDAHDEVLRSLAIARRITDARNHDQLVEAAAWLAAATALRTNRELTLAEMPPAPDRLLPKHDSQPSLDARLAVLAWWYELARLPDEQRALRRWQAPSDAPKVDFVRPAVVYVLGEAARDTDVEVWLDRLLELDHRRQPLATIVARAEAARWRGDTAAAKIWEERRKSRGNLITNDRVAALAAVFEGRL